MTPKLFVIAAILVVSWETTAGQLTVPARTLGFLYGGSNQRPKVELVGYLDPTCPDSKAAYPTLLKLAGYYRPDQLQLRLHLHNLPYHRNSHTISKATHVLDNYAPNQNTAFKWLSLIYSQYDNLTTMATTKLNDDQVLEMVANLAVQLTGIPKCKFVTQVADTDIDDLTRLDFKYGCTRGVSGTPMFTINDVFVDTDGWSFSTWKAAIDKLL